MPSLTYTTTDIVAGSAILANQTKDRFDQIQTVVNAKLDSTGGTITGNLSVDGTLSVNDNVTVASGKTLSCERANITKVLKLTPTTQPSVLEVGMIWYQST